MKNGEKNNDLLIGVLIGLVIALGVGVCLFASGAIKFNSNSTNSNQAMKENNNTSENENTSNINDTDINEVTFNNEKISIQDMSQENIHISSGGTEGINPNYDYYIDLYSSGKVKIRTIGMSAQNSNEHSEEFISNVNDVVDIIQFNVPAISDEQLIYMLQSNGDVYYYKVGDSKDKKFIATKVDNVSNVKKLFIYSYPIQKNSGGSWSIVAIKDNYETVALNTEGV